VPASDVASATVSTSNGNLSTLWIVLISVGGAVALSGSAFAATRLVRRRGHALT
jgi:hypothetical protein